MTLLLVFTLYILQLLNLSLPVIRENVLLLGATMFKLLLLLKARPRLTLPPLVLSIWTLRFRDRSLPISIPKDLGMLDRGIPRFPMTVLQAPI